MDTGVPNLDMDFKLYVNNLDKECVVSPINKYCAFARHFKDATVDSPGAEIINIKDLAVAQYKTTVEPAPSYNGKCKQAEDANVSYHSAHTAGWDAVHRKKNITKIPF